MCALKTFDQVQFMCHIFKFYFFLHSFLRSNAGETNKLRRGKFLYIPYIYVRVYNEMLWYTAILRAVVNAHSEA